MPDRCTLIRLLHAAFEAHHQYEVEVGHPDPNWIEYYVDHVVLDACKPEPPLAASAQPLTLSDL